MESDSVFPQPQPTEVDARKGGVKKTQSSPKIKDEGSYVDTSASDSVVDSTSAE